MEWPYPTTRSTNSAPPRSPSGTNTNAATRISHFLRRDIGTPNGGAGAFTFDTDAGPAAGSTAVFKPAASPRRFFLDMRG